MIDVLKFLAVIAMLEGGPNPPQAYGPYGISPGVLHDVNQRRGWSHTTADLADPAISLTVAREHLYWLTSRLLHRGITPTVTNLAACWRAGLSGYLQGKGHKYGAEAQRHYSAQP